MPQKKRRGFKAPANYEPGRKPARGKRGHGASTPRPERRDGQAPPHGAKDSTSTDRQTRRDRPDRDVRAAGSGKPARTGSASRASDRAGRDRETQRSARGGRSRDGAPGARTGTDERRGAAQVYTFDADGRATSGRATAPGRAGVPSSAGEHAARGSRTAAEQFERLDATLTTAADAAGLTFGDLGLGPNIVRVLGELGADAPFPIQAATIPDAIRGRDVLGRARTGSGKTIAFGAALVERLLLLKAQGAFASDADRSKQQARRGERQQRAPKRPPRNPKALILAPTRELALQIDRTVQPIARSVGFFTAQLVGGVPLDPQVHALERGIDIVIGTPGRVQDLVNRRKLDLREVVVSVIDEADHMCELGFLEPVQRVLRETVRRSQRLLFSATLDSGVSELVTEFLRAPAVHEAEEANAGQIHHRVLIVLREHKAQVLTELASAPGRIMVFCRTRAYAEQVAEMLEAAGVRAVALHGDLSQARRERNLEKFSTGKAAVLVATDVAARGIHVDDVDLVVQADPPADYKTYLHRAGRTGRAGKDGRVITVIPRTRQQRTRELFEQAEIEPEYFGDAFPGDTL